MYSVHIWVCLFMFFQSAQLDAVSNEKYLLQPHSFGSWPLFSWFLKKVSIVTFFSPILYFWPCPFLSHSFFCFLSLSFSPPFQQPALSLLSLPPEPHDQCFVYPSTISHIFSFCYLCGPVLLMYCHLCAKLACLLDSSAPEAERSISWLLDANPVSWATAFLFSQMIPALCNNEAELNKGFEDSMSSHAHWWAEGPW